MKCPLCGHPRTEVYNSRNTDEKRQIWRRRRCMDCKQAFTTYEASDLSFITVNKRDGAHEPFTRTKLMISLYHACIGLPDHLEALEGLQSTIEGKIASLHTRKISSEDIAIITLETLKNFHPGPYVRYLSFRGDISHSSTLREVTAKL